MYVQSSGPLQYIVTLVFRYAKYRCGDGSVSFVYFVTSSGQNASVNVGIYVSIVCIELAGSTTGTDYIAVFESV